MRRGEAFFDVLLELALVTDAEGLCGMVVDTLLDAAVRLFEADGRAVLLDDGSGWLRTAGARGVGAGEFAETVLSRGGPAVVAHARGQSATFLGETASGWPRFAAVAREHGVLGLHAEPLVLDGESLGVYCLVFGAPTRLSEQDAASAEVVARMAAVGLVNRHEVEEGRHRVAQLQHALDSRVVIERAKGVISGKSGIDPRQAFEVMRGAARASGTPLTRVARDIIKGRGLGVAKP